jgi:small subunit ribosomal protein S1
MSKEGKPKEQNLTREQLEEQYMKTLHTFEEGQLISGKVIQVSAEQVFVDVGYKSEGKIPVEEFEEVPEIGSEVSVVLVRKEGREGSIIVSKSQADEKLFWQKIRKAFAEKKPIEGKITKSNKGGFDVDLGFDVHGFLPMSKVDVSRVPDDGVEAYQGITSHFFIERMYSGGKINIVLSRRAWLEQENKRKREDFFKDIKIGDEVSGTVKSFTSFGAFIDLGGFDGLLHINDMSWGHVSSPKYVVNVGDELNLKVIRLDPDENRINLSLKHFTEDPWSTFEDRYHENDIVKAKVTKLTDFGAFIELEEGIEGLAHISEFSWVKRIRHPKELLKIGDHVDVRILSYDITKGKVSLGLKQVHPNPWDDVSSRYPVGMRLKRKVKNLASFGAFLELEEGIDGLLHLDDFSWTRKHKHPSEALSEGEEIEVMVIDIDQENNRIKLGLKQLSEDPWKSLQKAYRRGSVINGEITNITDFGFFVKVQGDIEGLIGKNQLVDLDSENVDEVLSKFKVGDAIRAVVLDINPHKQKLALSRREFLKKSHEEELARYIADENEENTVTLGDLLKDKSSE